MKLTAASLFEWPSRHNIHIALPLFLIFSFLVHAGAVLVFQVSYPHTRAMPPRSTQVYFLKPGSKEATLIEPMLAGSDPALFSPAQAMNRIGWELPDAGYVPSFDSRKPSLAALPAPAAGPVILEMKIPQTFSSQPQTSIKNNAGLPTQIELGGALKGREITLPQGVAFTANPPHMGLAPVDFLVAVSAQGLPLHLFQQSSSGDEALDRVALAYLAKCRFSPLNEAQPAWGTATVLWGSDVVRRKEP